MLRKYDILLVADEVICGFGRTGNMFGSQTFGIAPDIMILSKAITSTYFPFTAVLVNDRVYQPIADESDTIGVLGHGFTSGGHPVGAAVALENLKIIEERGLVAQSARVGAYLQKKLTELTAHPMVGQARGVGMIGALELVTDKTTKKALEPVGKLGAMVNAVMQRNGVISRNMGDAMAFCQPLNVEEADIDHLIDVTRRSIDEVHHALQDALETS